MLLVRVLVSQNNCHAVLHRSIFCLVFLPSDTLISATLALKLMSLNRRLQVGTKLEHKENKTCYRITDISLKNGDISMQEFESNGTVK